MADEKQPAADSRDPVIGVVRRALGLEPALPPSPELLLAREAIKDVEERLKES